MGHPAVENKTPFAAEVLFLIDEDARPLAVPVVKATFLFDGRGRTRLADEQVPLCFEGEPWGEDPGTSSYKYEPEVAFFKPATDVVLNGHAHAPRADTREMRIGLQVGPVRKEITVLGDRVWFKSLVGDGISPPQPFDKMPLVYERAYGGWDRTHPDPERHTCEARNPVGTGYATAVREGLRLPNLEDPRAPITKLESRPSPASFGFTCPHWQPRAALAGTYDAAWSKERAPLLPKDFDRRFLNAASPGLITPGYLRGDEQVLCRGVVPRALAPTGDLSFRLPAVQPVTARIATTDGWQTPPDAPLAMPLDTVIVEPDEARVLLFWRVPVTLKTGPHDLVSVEIR